PHALHSFPTRRSSDLGAHYDPIELLRPAWPLHAELDQLAARAPRRGIGAGEGRVIAFGSHAGKLPGALSPSAEHAGGPLRLVPLDRKSTRLNSSHVKI